MAARRRAATRGDLTAEPEPISGFDVRDHAEAEQFEVFSREQQHRLCTCPNRDGFIHHQWHTCTDPIAARLGWYADEPEPLGERCGDCGYRLGTPGHHTECGDPE